MTARAAAAASSEPRWTPGTRARTEPVPPSTTDQDVPGRPPTAAPRTTPGRSADGRQWELRSADTGIAAVTPSGTVAEAHVSEQEDVVVVELRADRPGLPSELSSQLVTQAFSLPAVRTHRPVLVCVPRHDGALLDHARRHVEEPRTHAAGVTCMIEGRVQERADPT